MQAQSHLREAWLYHAFAAVFEFTTQPFSYVTCSPPPHPSHPLPPRTRTRHVLQPNQFIFCCFGPPSHARLRYKSAECIFHAAAVLVNTLFFASKRDNISPPPGVTASNVFFAIIKVADGLGAYKAMRAVLDKMKLLRFPANWRSRVELASIMALGRPFTDPDELCPRCARCGTELAPLRAMLQYPASAAAAAAL